MTQLGFQTGGALRAGAVYALRPADDELFEALSRGELCSILAPRQMGKSSLRARTAARLRERGIHTATLDLSALGSVGLGLEQWLLGGLDELCCELGLPDPLDAWLAGAHLPPIRRWLAAMRSARTALGPLVVFIDEVDAVLGLPFSADDLFGAIRSMFDDTTSNKDRAPVFCLLGVAAPSDLMRDPERTPFNVGHRLRLEDLSRAQCAVFEPALAALSPSPAALMDAVWAWSLGHPYMTQRICAALCAEGYSAQLPEDRVSLAVERLFFEPGPLGDVNLASAARALLAGGGRGAGLLALYRRVWEGLGVAADESDPAVARLLLTGMVAREPTAGGVHLRVRNPIFRQTFDRAWIEDLQGRRALMDATAQWVANGRVDRDLIRGSALDEARQWAEGRPDLAPDEVRLLLESAEAEGAERIVRTRLEEEARAEASRRRVAEAHAEAQRRLSRRLALALGLAVLALLGAGGLYLALRAAGRGLEATRQEQAEVWSEVAAPLSLVPGREAEAIVYGLRAADFERRTLGRTQAETLLHLSRATARSSLWTRLRLSGDHPRALLWAPDGALLVATEGGAIEVWDVGRRARRSRFKEGEGAITSLLALPDGWLSASLDGSVRRHTLDGAVVTSWRAHERGVLDLALSPDGSALATAGQLDGQAKIWSLEGDRLATLSGPEPVAGHAASLYTVAWRGDGHEVIVGVEGGGIWAWPPVDGAPGEVLDAVGIAAQVFSLLPMGDDGLFAGDDAGWLNVVDLSTRRVLRSPRASASSVRDLAAGADGRTIFSVGEDGVLRQWDPDGSLLRIARGPDEALVSVAPGPDGQSVAMSGATDELRIWWGHSRQALATLALDTDFLPMATWLGPDRIATASKDGQARIWTPSDGQSLSLPHPSPLDCVARGPRGELLTVAEDGVMRRWDPSTGAAVGAEVALGARVIQLLPGQGDALIAVTRDGPIWRLNPVTGEHRVVVNARVATEPGRYLAAVSPDGSRIAAPADGEEAGVWSLQSGARLLTLPGHSYLVRAVSYSPDGARLATAARDHLVRLWDASTGALQATLAGHSSWVFAVAWSPDGTRLASGSDDGTVRLWDAATGAPLAIFGDPRDGAELGQSKQAVYSVEFSPDGTRLVAAGSDGAARVYPADERGILASACAELDGSTEASAVAEVCASVP